MEQITEIVLIKTINARDSLRQLTPVQTRRTVLASKTSASGAEFTAAGVLGIRADIRLTVCSADYEGETEVELEGKRYSVYRTYEPSVFKTELYCQQRAGDLA